MTKRIGIDAGGTLTKIVYKENDEYRFQTFLTVEVNNLVEWINKFHPNAKLMLTGGKQKNISKLLQNSFELIDEFEATTFGIKEVLNRSDIHSPEEYLLVNVGTGTSMHSMSGESSERLGGSGIGGGTLMGLAYLLTEQKQFENIMLLAEKGDRTGIDLKVRDIYEGVVSPVGGDLTASNFGFLERMMEDELRAEDILACLVGMISETLMMIAIPFAKTIETTTIVFIGSTFQNNTLFKKQLQRFETLFGIKTYFPVNGQYSGALGALLSNR
ncbi:type II pantothenate kinase [Pseudalkalibacillus hwajinpoensis]|uniref:Type II pantothenate kinase n=1 Tax=Guptibacillus hwajinpoensis TaxID=208199 RepID=A0A4U1MPU2_9BACL|nr:type II pantothenate kinase [Pseudalkalibacillus hwajinpoensis]TKD72560.1 type II pantothenate kinase [Pseudalkalibacillus hwajinpoensis]